MQSFDQRNLVGARATYVCRTTAAVVATLPRRRRRAVQAIAMAIKMAFSALVAIVNNDDKIFLCGF